MKPKLKAVTHYARQRGWIFKLMTERQIRTPYLWNARFLLHFRDHVRPDEGYQQLILDRLDDKREADAESLMLAVCANQWNRAAAIPTLWHLVSTFKIRANLHSPLAMKTELWLSTERHRRPFRL